MLSVHDVILIYYNKTLSVLKVILIYYNKTC